MKKIDRQLKNDTPCGGFKNGAKDKKIHFVYYRNGKYIIEDLSLKKKGHSQKFK
jgi:hypothetical protein